MSDPFDNDQDTNEPHFCDNRCSCDENRARLLEEIRAEDPDYPDDGVG